MIIKPPEISTGDPPMSGPVILTVWNVAFEAGCLHANNKRFIIVHPEKLLHPLKEISSHALAWCKDYPQVISVIKSICLK